MYDRLKLNTGIARRISMALSQRERAVAFIAGGIATYAIRQDSLPEGTSLIDYILKAVPEEAKGDVTIQLIDEVFVLVSGPHGS